MRTTILLFMVLVCLACQKEEQVWSTTIKGRVMDSLLCKPLPNALVLGEGYTSGGWVMHPYLIDSVRTDSEGYFSISRTEDMRTLNARYQNYFESSAYSVGLIPHQENYTIHLTPHCQIQFNVHDSPDLNQHHQVRLEYDMLGSQVGNTLGHAEYSPDTSVFHLAHPGLEFKYRLLWDYTSTDIIEEDYSIKPIPGDTAVVNIVY